MIGKVLIEILKGDPDYVSGIGTDPKDGQLKIYRDLAPQSVKRPYATWNLISRTEDQDKDDRGVITYMVQVNHFASAAGQAEELDRLCIMALNRYQGVVAGVNVFGIRVVSGGSEAGEKIDDSLVFSEFSIKVNP